MNAPIIVIATHNPGKLREIGELLEPLSFSVTGAAELGLPEPEETGSSFAENAAIKSEAAATATGLIALADDSGLVVQALDGAPGVHSARWAGPERDFCRAMKRVERELKQSRTTDYSAKFVCALALTRPGKGTKVFEGEVSGTLIFPPRGTEGFGYDPIFIAEGMTQTFGEIQPRRKHEISHRARAFAKLIGFLERESTPA
ncbi:MAG TPA: RdgB/HAM1 family non-canonical purine NTP pyrophosphatase [Rhizomicrobium sp.]|nr:RdgB/HAM1 family non-canonical purine NTP pyrophosphatase [Rhizomicrobium sp.]